MEFVSVFNSMGVEGGCCRDDAKDPRPYGWRDLCSTTEEYEKRGVRTPLNTKVIMTSEQGLTVELPDGTAVLEG